MIDNDGLLLTAPLCNIGASDKHMKGFIERQVEIIYFSKGDKLDLCVILH